MSLAQVQVAASSGPAGPSLVRAFSSSGCASGTLGSVPPTPAAVDSTVQSGTVALPASWAPAVVKRPR
ncbi:hypothetical protein SGLAM104S_01431 [Streptomyces glaucescens]